MNASDRDKLPAALRKYALDPPWVQAEREEERRRRARQELERRKPGS